jgi:CheY-like chemotaxis protein
LRIGPRAFILVRTPITKPFERATLLDQLRALTGVSVARRVLIIDDNEVDRYLLKQRLANLPAAISITEASSGLQGLDMALQCRPDLIFLDVAMPGMTGFEVLEKLKNTSELINIPVVIVTSHILSDIERELLMKDAVSIISKDDLSAAAINAAFDRSLRETEAPETTTDQLRLFWQGR